jgi:uncharacterized membrane protein YczE
MLYLLMPYTNLFTSKCTRKLLSLQLSICIAHFDVNINMAISKIDKLMSSICDEWKVKVLVDTKF